MKKLIDHNIDLLKLGRCPRCNSASNLKLLINTEGNESSGESGKCWHGDFAGSSDPTIPYEPQWLEGGETYYNFYCTTCKERIKITVMHERSSKLDKELLID